MDLNGNQVIAVDFDGTLCKQAWPEIGEENEILIEHLKGQQAAGARLILWTNREGDLLEEAVEWCKAHGLTFDTVNANLTVDHIVAVNLIGFIPQEVRAVMAVDRIGTMEFFAILFVAYEIISILKNMYLCGLPVKKIWQTVKAFLQKYTDELPADEESEEPEALEEVAAQEEGAEK